MTATIIYTYILKTGFPVRAPMARSKQEIHKECMLYTIPREKSDSEAGGAGLPLMGPPVYFLLPPSPSPTFPLLHQLIIIAVIVIMRDQITYVCSVLSCSVLFWFFSVQRKRYLTAAESVLCSAFTCACLFHFFFFFFFCPSIPYTYIPD